MASCKESDGGMKRDRGATLLNDEVLSRVMRGLSPLVPPPMLSTSLRVLASRELSRRSGKAWQDRLRLFADNLARPLALPFAGGVFTTVILFSMWLVPTYPMRVAASGFDVPTVLSTEATVKGTGPIGAAGGDMVVDVTIDGGGRMVDYAVVQYNNVSGRNVLNSEALRRNLENMLLFTEFTPATSFGQPTAGKIRLYLDSSHIDVKG
jgi:hypothetical protein